MESKLSHTFSVVKIINPLAISCPKHQNTRITKKKYEPRIVNETETTITTQARHDCEKIAITGLEPASQDRSS